MKKKVTSTDIAHAAGVSQSTVSMILNKKYDVSFAKDTVERVENAAKELGYVPPKRKTRKGTKREKLLVVFCPNLTNPYYVMLLQGIEAHAKEKGFGLFVCNTQRDLRMEERYLKMMWQLRPLGIIYTCNPSHCFMELVGEIAEQIPVAIVNNQNEKMNVDAVELDNSKLGRVMAKHLLELGHRKVAYIAPPLTARQKQRSKRVEGFLKEYEKVGLRDQVIIKAAKEEIDLDVAHIDSVAPLPKQAIFPLGQHIGAPAKPVVAKGDKVKVGTLIAEAGGFVSAPIYSSVSGTVFKVDTSIDATGYRKPCIIINVEGDEWEESIDRSDKLETLEAHTELTPEEIVNRIKVAGVTGMGGAGFPTFIKLCPPPGAKAECVIINGVECEPYITADYRLMMEHADEILVGLNLLMKAAKVEKGYIGIEDNKPAAIKLFEEKTANDARIEIVPLAKKYPQGGEKQLVDAVIRRQVPAPPAIPVNVGAIVQNVGTAFAVYQAVMKNKPLFERYTTVTGKQVKNPGNFLVRMGTPFSQMIENCGGLPEGDNKVLAGGPMMGKAVISLDVPVTKGTNSITVLTDADAHRKKAQPCIRCAKCVDACPMGLEPYLLATLSVVKDYERLEAEEVTSCIACGSCQFTCPSHRPILDNIINGKGAVMGIIRARNAKK